MFYNTSKSSKRQPESSPSPLSDFRWTSHHCLCQDKSIPKVNDDRGKPIKGQRHRVTKAKSHIVLFFVPL
ncbi:MAG: hypothetical protein DRH20_12305 [Deltaproteobacteria bacterium]|nr:MAG: hypothetical protein DRH20_12305 [Deltaproteobacteria bacterium]